MISSQWQSPSSVAVQTHVHGGQVRKETSIPYIAHLLAVAAAVLEYGGSEDMAIAGLLHDAAEDQGGENHRWFVHRAL
jgi:(p)ppGpp synthase/HD superfamily hydrolase